MASTASSSSFRTAESLDFSLLLVDKLQRSPRHIPRDVAQPIRRFEVCRLHERIDVGNFKHTLLPGNTHRVASLWDRHAGSCIHLVLQSSALARTDCLKGRAIAAILTPLPLQTPELQFLTCLLIINAGDTEKLPG